MSSPKTEGEREQIKLGAAYLNGLAIGLALVGGLSVPTTILLNAADNTIVLAAFIVAAVCLSASPVLHLLARKLLKELDR